MSKIKQTFAIFLITAGFLVVAEEASSIKGHYVESRKDVPVWNNEVCSAFKKYLDSFPPEDSYRGCGLKPSPTMKDITFPKWKKIDPLENAEIIKKMDDFTFNANYPNDLAGVDARHYVQKIISLNHHFSLLKAEFDVNNDGQLENVYRQDYLTSCPVKGRLDVPPRPRMIAFNEAGEVNKRVSNFLNVSSHYIFFYQGKTYRTFWGGTVAQSGITVSGWGSNDCYFNFNKLDK